MGFFCVVAKEKVNMELVINLVENGKQIPAWANNATFYYENEHKEQWIAAVVEDKLFISGVDIDWKEIVLDVENTKTATDYLLFGKRIEGNPLSRYNFNRGELLWIWSVIHASVEEMEEFKKTVEVQN